MYMELLTTHAEWKQRPDGAMSLFEAETASHLLFSTSKLCPVDKYKYKEFK